MTTGEFSNQFDVLVNSYRRIRDFDNRESQDTIDFNEYEKSLYLTKAQSELVVSLYTGRTFSLQSFEETEELRRYLSPLVEEAKLTPITNSADKPIGMEGTNSYFFTLPDREPSGDTEGTAVQEEEDVDSAVWFITYEAVLLADGKGKCESHTTMQVVPVTQDEYHRIRKNPFRGANDRRALRLDLSNNIVEIVCKYPVKEYYIRYLKRLKPIVLEDMPDDVTIEGVGTEQGCELHTALHQRILELAVQMALQSKGIGMTSQSTERRNNNRE